MNIEQFHQMFNDKHFYDFKKMQYKYPNDINEFVKALKEYYYTPLFVTDFNGNKIVYIKNKTNLKAEALKLLLPCQNKAYGESAVAEEIISTAKIENIDYSRESVRNILKGYTPADDEEDRILGMKKGFEFIADKKNIINEQNIYTLYMTAVGRFLDENDRLNAGRFYRHDDVHIQDLNGKISHFGVKAEKIPGLMSDLLKFINEKSEIGDLEKAAVIHFYIAYIHPYFDGNGRMARLLHIWYLVQKGYGNTLFIPFSGYIMKSRKKYYEAYTLIEENEKISGVTDVTPFIAYFEENVYNKFEETEIKTDVFNKFKNELQNGNITEKEEKLWYFIISEYGTGEFSTKQIEKDFCNVAYATVRSFVLKFEKFGLLTSQHYKNRVKYKINNA